MSPGLAHSAQGSLRMPGAAWYEQEVSASLLTVLPRLHACCQPGSNSEPSEHERSPRPTGRSYTRVGGPTLGTLSRSGRRLGNFVGCGLFGRLLRAAVHFLLQAVGLALPFIEPSA